MPDPRRRAGDQGDLGELTIDFDLGAQEMLGRRGVKIGHIDLGAAVEADHGPVADGGHPIIDRARPIEHHPAEIGMVADADFDPIARRFGPVARRFVRTDRRARGRRIALRRGLRIRGVFQDAGLRVHEIDDDLVAIGKGAIVEFRRKLDLDGAPIAVEFDRAEIRAEHPIDIVEGRLEGFLEGHQKREAVEGGLVFRERRPVEDDPAEPFMQGGARGDRQLGEGRGGRP